LFVRFNFAREGFHLRHDKVAFPKVGTSKSVGMMIRRLASGSVWQGVFQLLPAHLFRARAWRSLLMLRSSPVGHSAGAKLFQTTRALKKGQPEAVGASGCCGFSSQ
jgi:hypothetical protein